MIRLYELKKRFEVDNPNRIPATAHFVILMFGSTSVHHEADERSKTHPGHGYPAYTETIKHVKVFVCPTENDMREMAAALYAEDPKRTDLAFLDVSRSREATIKVDI